MKAFNTFRITKCNEAILLQSMTRLVLSRFFYILGNLENVKEKSIRKTCFSREMKRLALPKSTEFLLKFHEIEMFKPGRIYEKFLKRKLERKLVA